LTGWSGIEFSGAIGWRPMKTGKRLGDGESNAPEK